jgi:hypothetical protein
MHINNDWADSCRDAKASNRINDSCMLHAAIPHKEFLCVTLVDAYLCNNGTFRIYVGSIPSEIHFVNTTDEVIDFFVKRGLRVSKSTIASFKRNVKNRNVCFEYNIHSENKHESRIHALQLLFYIRFSECHSY